MGQWRGVCTVCKRDLYTDPARHYASRSHYERAKAWEKREREEREHAAKD